jgi:hypothetical protein
VLVDELSSAVPDASGHDDYGGGANGRERARGAAGTAADKSGDSQHRQTHRYGEERFGRFLMRFERLFRDD